MLADPRSGSDSDEQLENVSALTRRSLFRRSAASGAVLGAGGLLAACGSSGSGSGAASTAASSSAGGSSTSSAGPEIGKGFTPSPGTDIPKVSVAFAMWPYGDTTLGVVGIRKGWFDELGIAMPNNLETRLSAQTQTELLNNQLQISSGYVPLTIQTYAHSPQLKMIQLTNSYIGNYALASPKTGAKTYAQFAAQGQPFATAFKNTVQQMKGKQVALSDTGANRPFFGTILKLAGMTPSDFTLHVVNDTKIVELGKAGSIDYAFPAGAAQNVELLDVGFYRTAGIDQMVAGLPKGNADAVGGIGHAGLQSSVDYVSKNMETVLRFMSVFFRIIDAVQNNPLGTLTVSLPTLSSTAGVDITLTEAAKLFKLFYGTVNFEQSAQLMLDPTFPLYYETVYNPQITAAESGGIVPKGTTITPDDLIIFKPLYQILVNLKHQYDSLKPTKKPGSQLATEAAVHYQNRNYLDAFRLLKAAA
jgi:ABC-type nitrate/sulfonate/bicarbonate transport system substrate-binding protein